MTNAQDWKTRVGRSWAASYAHTDRSFAGLTRLLLERIATLAGTAVLDIGCGAGELSLAVAAARPGARIAGIDISADLVGAARARAAGVPGLEFIEGDAATWSAPGFAPDLLVSRHGVMFFADPRGAFAHLRGIAREGAMLCFSCFRAARANPWASGLAALLDLPPPADPLAPGPFAFADPERVRAILDAAGWEDAVCEAADFAYVAGAGADPVADALALFRRIGPAAPVLRALGAAEGTAAEARISAWLERHRHGDTVRFDAAAWIVSARRR